MLIEMLCPKKLHYTQLTVDIFKAEFEGTPINHHIYLCVGIFTHAFSHNAQVGIIAFTTLVWLWNRSAREGKGKSKKEEDKRIPYVIATALLYSFIPVLTR